MIFIVVLIAIIDSIHNAIQIYDILIETVKDILEKAFKKILYFITEKRGNI